MMGQQHIAKDVVLNYRVVGTGPEPLVCVHGVGSSMDAWALVIPYLTDKFTVVTFDLRGHGGSTKIKGRYEIDHFVDDTLSIANAVGLKDFCLAGFSLGGLVAQRIALMHPDRVKRLFLFSTSASRTDEERESVLARLVALKSTEPGSHYMNSMARWFSDEFRKNNPGLMETLRERNARNDPECYASAYRVLAETDFGGLLDRIMCPTLIATGEFDVGSNPRMARAMHESIAGSELKILDGLPPFDPYRSAAAGGDTDSALRG